MLMMFHEMWRRPLATLMSCRTSWEIANISQLISREINIFVYEAYEQNTHYMTLNVFLPIHLFSSLLRTYYWDKESSISSQFWAARLLNSLNISLYLPLWSHPLTKYIWVCLFSFFISMHVFSHSLKMTCLSPWVLKTPSFILHSW